LFVGGAVEHRSQCRPQVYSFSVRSRVLLVLQGLLTGSAILELLCQKTRYRGHLPSCERGPPYGFSLLGFGLCQDFEPQTVRLVRKRG
jgi:hypothetical protein